MKKTLVSLLVSLSTLTGTVQAEDLLSAYQMAKANDPVVLKAEAQVNAAKEDIIQARSSLLPQIGASASYTKASQERVITSGGIVDGSSGINIVTSKSKSLSYGADFSMQLYHHNSWLRMGTAKKAAHRSDVFYQAAMLLSEKCLNEAMRLC